MSPIVKKYLENNVGKLIAMDEYLVGLLVNALLSDPEGYDVIDISPINSSLGIQYWGLAEIGIVTVKGTIIVRATSEVENDGKGLLNSLQNWLDVGDVDELTSDELCTLEGYTIKDGVSLESLVKSMFNPKGDGVIQKVVITLSYSLYKLNLVRDSGRLITEEYVTFEDLKKSCNTQYESYLMEQITKVINPSELTYLKLGVDAAGNVVVKLKH